MADREATIVIRYVSDVAEAKKAYDDLRREVESNPIRLGTRVQTTSTNGSRVGETATFSGGSGEAPGGGIPGVSASRGPVPSPGEAGINASVVAAHAGTGRVPTAATNTVYGDTGVSASVGPYGSISQAPGGVRFSTVQARGGNAGDWMSAASVNRDQANAARYEIYQRRFREAGIVGPMLDSDQYNTAAGRVYAQEDFRQARMGGGGGPPSGPSWFARNFPNLRTDFGRAASGYSLLRTATAAFEGPNAYALGQAQNAGDFAGASADAIANDPTRRFVEGIPFVGPLASEAAEYLTGSRSAAARTLAEARIQTGVTAFQRSQGLGLLAASYGLSTARAGLASPLGGQIADIDAQIAQLEPQRAAAFDASSVDLRKSVTAANQARDLAGQNFDSETGIRVREFFGNTAGIAEARAKRLAPYEGKVTDAETALTDAEGKSKEIRDKQEATLRVARFGLQQADNEVARTLRQGTNLTGIAADLSLSGRSFAGTLAGLDAQFQPTIDQSQRGIDRALAANLDPAESLYEQRDAARSSLRYGRRAAGRARLDQLGDISGGFAEAAGAMAFDPFGGRSRGIEASYGGRLSGLDVNSPDATILRAQRDQELAGVRQQQNLQRIDFARGNAFESRSLDARFARDSVGASAIDFANGAIGDLQNAARSGVSTDLIEQRRANFVREEKLKSRDYALSFRGTQFDLQNLAIDNQRDGQNPGEVFARIAGATESIQNANANEGKVDAKLDKDTTDAIGAAVAAAMASLLATN